MAGISVRKAKHFRGNDLNHVSWLNRKWSLYLFPFVVEDATNCEIETRALGRWLTDFEKSFRSSKSRLTSVMFPSLSGIASLIQHGICCGNFDA